MKIKNLNKSSSLKLEVISPDLIPYACHYDKETILTKAGELLQVIKIVGFTYEVFEETIDLRTTLRNAISDNIKHSNFSFWIHTVRRKVDLDPGGEFSYFFAEKAHEAWCKKNYWHDKYINELYITIVYRNLDISINSFKDFLNSLSYSRQIKIFKSDFEKFHAQLENVADNIVSGLSEYGARKLTIEEDEYGPYSEQLQFFGKIIHLSESKMPLPVLSLSKYLARSRIAFGNINFEIRNEEKKRFGAIFSIKEYHELPLSELDKFLQLPQEMVITQSVNFINSKKLFKKYNYQNYILNVSGDTEFGEMSGLTNMLSNLGDNYTDYGNSQLTVMIMADTLDLLEQYVKKSINTVLDLGIVVVREDLNLENCYLAQLPGNFQYLVRNSPINSKFVGGFASLYNFPAGKLTSKWGKALTLFRTALGTPYFFNFHHAEIGHTLIVGPKASGKNTLLNFLLSESCKYQANIIIFDLHNKSELLVNALNETYYQAESIQVNPFALEPNIENINFIANWVVKLIYDEQPSQSIDSVLKNLVTKFYNSSDEKNIINFFKLIEIEEFEGKDHLLTKIENLKSRIKIEDKYSKDNAIFSKITAFETGYDDIKLYNSIILYLIHKIKITLSDQPTIIVLQNFSNLIKIIDIKELLEFLSANNAIAIILVDENENELVKSIIKYIPTNILLPHENINKNYQNIYNMTDSEFHSFKNIKSLNRHFLLRQNDNTIIAELNLSGINDILAVLTSNMKHKDQMIKSKNDKGAEPEQWLPDFFKNVVG